MAAAGVPLSAADAAAAVAPPLPRGKRSKARAASRPGALPVPASTAELPAGSAAAAQEAGGGADVMAVDVDREDWTELFARLATDMAEV